MPVVIGVDLSTQSTKVEARDIDNGDLVASGKISHPPTGVAPISEANPADWWTAFESAYRDTGSPKATAISVAGQQHGLVLLDDQHKVVRPAKLWNDTQSSPDATWCLTQRDSHWWAQHVGSVPLASFTITKANWVKRNEPTNWQRVARIGNPHDYLTWRLRGGQGEELTTDRGDASGTGYWSPMLGAYDREALNIVDSTRDWPSMLPRVAQPMEKTGEWNGAAIAPGSGDNMAGALGLGLMPGDVAISLGTSGTVYTVSAKPTTDATGAVAGFADATGAFLPLVCTLNATKVFDFFANLAGVDIDQFGELALGAPCGADGLTLLPYLDGERTPNLPDARGILVGLSSSHSRQSLARAAIEGVVCGLLDGLQAITNCGVNTSGRLFLLGGGARSAATCQIVADLTGRDVLVSSEQEIVALGAARQAAAVVHGSWPSWTASSQIAAHPLATEKERVECRERFAIARHNSFGL